MWKGIMPYVVLYDFTFSLVMLLRFFYTVCPCSSPTFTAVWFRIVWINQFIHIHTWLGVLWLFFVHWALQTFLYILVLLWSMCNNFILNVYLGVELLGNKKYIYFSHFTMQIFQVSVPLFTPTSNI